MALNKTFWTVVLIGWMLGSTWWHVCRIKQLCPTDEAPEATTTAARVVRMPSLIVADSSLFRLALPGNFSFARSGANANMNTLMGSLNALTSHLKTTGRQLTITGYYTGDETNATTLPNLGLARAEGIRQYLVQQGIPADRLMTVGEQKNSLVFTPANDSLYGGIMFAFSAATAPGVAPDTVASVGTVPDTLTTDLTSSPTAPGGAEAAVGPLPETEQGLAEAEKFTSVFEPIDLYFPLSEADYIKTGETRKFFDEAARYLAAHKDKTLRITGYTDNTGSEEANLRLSRDRANGVKNGLRRSGIDSDQLVVEAKGEADPKASNDTRAGRKANRRVMVVVR